MAVEWITWAVNQKTGSATNKAVLMAICNHANGQGYCWPSQKEIQKFTELSIRSIQRAIQELEKQGFIKRTERRRADGTRSSDSYLIQGDRVAQGDTESCYQGDRVSQNKATECQGNIYPTDISEPSPSEPSKTRANVPNPFAVWWDKYPHKIGKGAAEKAFWKAIKETDLETLLDGLERYISTKPPDRAWCNPSTWLNQKRWLDKPAEQDGKHETNRTNNRGDIQSRKDAAFDSAFDELYGTSHAAGDCKQITGVT